MKRFTEEMDDLVDSMVKMAKLATEMSNKSISSFCKRDVGVADDVINSFSIIRNYDMDIEKKAIRILTLYQPAACDMRTIATVLKCITYLERIGKYSKNIADATHYLKDKPAFEPESAISDMGTTVVKMVSLVTEGFIKSSVDGFDGIVDMDDHLDATMRENMTKVIDFIVAHPESAHVCTYYISIMKYIERMGDHACKMAEKVTFMVTGMHTEIK